MKLCADRTGTASLVLGATTGVPSTAMFTMAVVVLIVRGVIDFIRLAAPLKRALSGSNPLAMMASPLQTIDETDVSSMVRKR
jgi:hypothetical protein